MPPAYSDMAQHFGFQSDGTVRTYLEHLENKGYIQRLGRARGIKILKDPHPSRVTPHSIPIVGKIAAGIPKEAIEEHLGDVGDLPELHQKEGRFALRVQGDSMKDAGILNGDFAIIQTQVPVHNGQIAAVIYNGEATLKRIYFEQDRVRLQPENEFFHSTYIPRTEFESAVLGRYIALVRQA